MALTTTFLNSAAAVGDTKIVLSAFTNPSTGPIGPGTMLAFATGERCLVTDVTASPTLGVVRGWLGTKAVAHNLYEGITYGLTNDAAWPAGVVTNNIIGAIVPVNTQEITATGATGTTAAVVTVPFPAYLNATGTSGAGINLPVPTVGMEYWVKNLTTGALKVYSVGATINGTTGTTAVTISATGNLAEAFWCSTAGAWQVAPIAT